MSEQQNLIPLAVGERLRRRRRDRKLSVNSVASSLRVPVEVVRAIEQDGLERYAPLYRKGHIRSYARLLGFDDADTQEMLDDVDSSQPRLQPAYSLAPRAASSDRWLRAGSYLLASLLIGTLAWQLTHEAVRLSQGETEGQVNRADEARATDTQTADPASPGRSARHVNASIAALENIPQQKVAPSGVGREAWDALRDPAPEDTADLLQVPNQHELGVKTSGDCWVEISDATGEQLEMDLVRGGSERHYRGEAPFSIVVGRVSAIELTMDGQAIDLSGHTSGNVAQATIGPAAGADEAMEQEAHGD